MLLVEATQWFPYSPQTIYDLLTDPQSLAAVVGRIQQAKVVERHENHGKLAVVLDLPMKKVETIGEVVGTPAERLSFKTQEPFVLEFSWQFTPQAQEGQGGTQVISRLELDLSAFGMPFGGKIIQGILAGELHGDLQRLEEALAKLTR